MHAIPTAIQVADLVPEARLAEYAAAVERGRHELPIDTDGSAPHLGDYIRGAPLATWACGAPSQQTAAPPPAPEWFNPANSAGSCARDPLTGMMMTAQSQEEDCVLC